MAEHTAQGVLVEHTQLRACGRSVFMQRASGLAQCRATAMCYTESMLPTAIPTGW